MTRTHPHRRALLLLAAGLWLAAAGPRAEVRAYPPATGGVAPRVLREAATAGTVEILVVLKEQADLAAPVREMPRAARVREVHERLRRTAVTSQRPLLEWLDARGVDYRAFWIVNMVQLRADPALLGDLVSRPEVARIVANPRVRLESPRVDPEAPKSATGVQWNIAKVNADQVWQLGYTGQGVVVAAQDTGFRFGHSALIGQYRGWDAAAGVATHAYNWHDAIHVGGGSCGSDSSRPCDDGSHGTHVMGILAGDDGATNVVGIAPGARWIGCRNMDQGDGTPATYAECFQWFLAPTDEAGLNPDPTRAPHVINNSWICTAAEGCDTETLQAVVQAVRAAGIVVVGSAGNSGSICGSVAAPPAIYDETITVGATNSADAIAGFSSRGPVSADGSGRMKPDISAPGVLVRSSVPPDGYASYSGTSMSGPHVTGVVALLLGARPDLAGRVDEIEFILYRSATPLVSAQTCGDDVPGLSVPNNVFGWGRVDALEAIRGDADGDGVDNLADCLPADPSAAQAPDPAASLTLEGGASTSIHWSCGDTGAAATRTTLLRSLAPGDFSTADCLPGDDGTASDDELPAAAFFYLVQVENACGRTSGTASDMTPRATRDCP